MGDVYVVGIDMIKFGKLPDRSVAAARRARRRCWRSTTPASRSRTWRRCTAATSMQANAMVGQRILQQIGQTGIPGRQLRQRLRHRRHRVPRGLDRDQGGRLRRGARGRRRADGARACSAAAAAAAASRRRPARLATMPAVFAEAGMEHARKYGTTFEQFAKVSVKNHHHSTLNPKAMYQIETPLEEVMSAEMISYPNTKLMCSVNVDGSAAAVLVSEKKAKELGMKRAVRVQASVLTSDRLAGARPRHARRQHLHAPRGEEGLRDGRRRPAATSTWSSCTTASRRPRSCTTRTSASARTARPAG